MTLIINNVAFSVVALVGALCVQGKVGKIIKIIS